MTILFYITLCIFLGLCGLLCLIILIQESKSIGLGASFGGDSGDSIFGTSTADILKKITVYLAVIFMAGSILLSLWTAKIGRTHNVKATSTVQELVK